MFNDNILLNTWSVQNYIRICADKANLSVTFSSEIKAPMTKGNTIYLPSLNSYTSHEDITKLMRYVNNVVSHQVYKTDFNLVEKYNLAETTSPLGIMWSLWNDARVDRYDYKEWKGDSENMEEYFDTVFEEASISLDRMSRDDKIDKDAVDIISTLLVTEAMVRSNWMAAPNLHLKDMANSLSPKAKKYLSKFIKGEYAEEINNTPPTKKGSEEIMKIAERAYKDMFDLDPEEEKKKMENEGKSSKEGCTGKDDGSSKETDTHTGGNRDKSKDINKDIQEIYIKYEETKRLTESMRTNAADIHLDYTEYTKSGDSFDIAPASKIKILDFETRKARNISFLEEEGIRNERTKSHLHSLNSGGKGAALANRVRKLLQIKTKTRYEYGTKRGKIHDRSLYRATMKEAKGFNERIFKKKYDNHSLDTVVSLLVDFSGSMGTSKMAIAIHSSLLLQEAINQSLRIPLEIIGFSDSGKSSIMMVFKSFDRTVTQGVLQDRMLEGTSYMIQNADGEAISWTHSRLALRREKRKIMIVLSDGSPASDRPGNIYKYTKDVVAAIENSKATEIVGIGIEDKNVSRFYKQHYVINEADQLEEALLHVIEKKML